MRTIKFRAKTIDGLWVYGEPHLSAKTPHIHQGNGVSVPINPETLCEFTGITVFGQELYENDIYTVEKNVKNAMLRHVIFNISGFAGHQIGRKQEDFRGNHIVPVDDMEDVYRDIYIVGNSIDNPELLEAPQRTADELLEVAADWWIDKTFNTLLNQDNGEESHFALLNFFSVKSKEGITQEQIETFRAEFIKSLKTVGYRQIYVGVDYGPTEHLAVACEKAKINDICLPCKTNMNIYVEEGYISVSFGYGSPYVKI